MTEGPLKSALLLLGLVLCTCTAAHGLILFKHGSRPEIVEKFPEAAGESGLAFQPLAQFQLLELGRDLKNQSRRPVSLDSFYSNVVWHPGPLTPYFLGREPESESV